MSDDRIQYDILALDAMRGVIRAVLQRVQKRGIPGDHHFYISFGTQTPGVQLSKRLRDRYPEEMTIVIQHQFWDLQVMEDRFEVKLSFNNVPERLVIPFAAIRRFHDPSVDFGFNLQVFDTASRGMAGRSTSPAPPSETNENTGTRGGVPLIPDQTSPAHERLPAAAIPESAGKSGGGQQKTAEIVKLDTFRKK